MSERKYESLHLPKGLVQKAAQELKRGMEASDRIREEEERKASFQSGTKDIYLMVEQLGPSRWKSETIEPMTVHGTVVAYGHSCDAVCGAEARMALIRALIQAGIYNEYEPCKEYVCTKVNLIAANIRRL